jgi:hypothetical protein
MILKRRIIGHDGGWIIKNRQLAFNVLHYDAFAFSVMEGVMH